MQILRSRLHSWKERLWYFFGGMCMGAADIIPGVSGGTMAFVLGFYEQLISGIRSITSLTITRTIAEFIFLLLGGVLTSIVLLSGIFHTWMNDPEARVYLFSVFFGLIAGSLIFCAKQLKRWRPVDLVTLFFAAVLAYILTGNDPAEQKEDAYGVKITLEAEARNYNEGLLTNVNASQIAFMLAENTIEPTTPVVRDGKWMTAKEAASGMEPGFFNFWLIGCGILAASAMLLPGISGSYILVMLGAYPIVIGAVADLIASIQVREWDSVSAGILFNIAIGIIIGLLIFCRVVAFLLARYHNLTIAALIGFMIGALHTVWPFVHYAYEFNPLKLNKAKELIAVHYTLPDPTSPLFFKALLCMLLGAAFVILAEITAIRITRLKSIAPSAKTDRRPEL